MKINKKYLYNLTKEQFLNITESLSTVEIRIETEKELELIRELYGKTYYFEDIFKKDNIKILPVINKSNGKGAIVPIFYELNFYCNENKLIHHSLKEVNNCKYCRNSEVVYDMNIRTENPFII